MVIEPYPMRGETLGVYAHPYPMTAQGSRPQVVYLAGPYRPYVDDEGVRHTIAENVKEAGDYGVELWRRGYVALVPHTLTYFPRFQKQDGSIKGVSAESFMEGELELVRRSDMVVLMPTSVYSRGAKAEAQYALNAGIPVYSWEEFLHLDDQRKGMA